MVKFCSYLNRNIFKHLETLKSLQSLGFGLIDGNDVRATISALDKRFMDTVKTIRKKLGFVNDLLLACNITRESQIYPLCKVLYYVPFSIFFHDE